MSEFDVFDIDAPFVPDSFYDQDEDDYLHPLAQIPGLPEPSEQYTTLAFSLELAEAGPDWKAALDDAVKEGSS